jgi:hypothetical protein
LSAFCVCLLLARDYERGTTIALCPGCGTGGCAVVALGVVLGVIAAIELVAVDGAVR